MLRRWLFPILLLLSLTACSGAQSKPTPAAGEIDSGLLVAVQGEASVKRAGWQSYAPALFGAPLRKGDLLRLGAAARATVACADLKLADLPAGVSGLPCKSGAGQGSLVYGGSLLTPTRGEPGVGEYPVVVSPRKTRLLDPRPTLQWTPAPGAASYRVSLQGTDWSTTVEGATEVIYPPDAPALKPGTAYRLVVQAGDRSSSEEPGAGLGFTLLSSDEAQPVRDAEAQIVALDLADAATRLLVANLYANHGLHAEAIATLRPLAAAGEPAAARLSGELYLTVGLNRQAEESYLGALALSQTADDVEGQVIARAALGRIYDLLGNQEEAARYWQEAIAGYEQLGDTAKVAELRGLLAGTAK